MYKYTVIYYTNSIEIEDVLCTSIYICVLWSKSDAVNPDWKIVHKKYDNPFRERVHVPDVVVKPHRTFENIFLHTHTIPQIYRRDLERVIKIRWNSQHATGLTSLNPFHYIPCPIVHVRDRKTIYMYYLYILFWQKRREQ